MLNVMGSSIVSSWSNLLIPKVNGRVQENGDKSSDLPNSNYVVESYFIKSVGAKKFSHKTIKWDFVLSENCKDHFQLQMLEILLMFFTGVYHENNEGLISGFKIEYFSGEIKKKVNEQNEKNYQKEAHFSIEFSDACFNVMNFVNNLFLGEKYFEKVRESMKNAYVAYFKDIEKKEILKKGNDTKDAETKYLINLLKTDAENAKKVEQFLKDNSLYKKYNSWFEKTCGLAMPVYSFDMMYNIMKRKYQNMSIRNDDIYYKVFWKALDKFYLEVGQLLKQQDKRYFNELNTPFYDAYIESPFIDYIELLRNNEEWNEKFSKMILAVAEMPSSTDYNAE